MCKNFDQLDNKSGSVLSVGEKSERRTLLLYCDIIVNWKLWTERVNEWNQISICTIFTIRISSAHDLFSQFTDQGSWTPSPWMIDLCHNLSFSHYQLCHTENAKRGLRAKALESCIQTFRSSRRDIGGFTWNLN